MRKAKPETLPHWPRLLPGQLAAGYLGIGENLLSRLPVPSVRIGSRRLWDRQALDRFVDTLAETGQSLDSDDYWLGKLDDADAAETR